MKNEESREKTVKIRLNKKGKTVTFKIPQGLGGWYRFFRDNGQLLKNVRYIGITIAMITVINMQGIFTQIQFTQETTGTLIWAFVLLGMISWGFR